MDSPNGPAPRKRARAKKKDVQRGGAIGKHAGWAAISPGWLPISSLILQAREEKAARRRNDGWTRRKTKYIKRESNGGAR